MKTAKALKTEIIAVGSELLTPFFQDSNSLYITKGLNDLGIDVSFKTIVGDDEAAISQIFKTALERSDLIIAMGGLGPTRDDLTRETLAKTIGKDLGFNKAILNKIKQRFDQRGLPMAPVNKKQAYIINGAEIIENHHGTAPGQWLETDGRIIILLPGPPQELFPMLDNFVIPRLRKQSRCFSVRRVLKITGLTESMVENLIADAYSKNPDIEINTLAYPGQIEIHIKARSLRNQQEASTLVDQQEHLFSDLLGENIFSSGGEELEEIVGNLLRAKKKTLATAESCTGGLLGHRITNIPGSSDYYLEGVTVYSNAAKVRQLGLSYKKINRFGAVSEETAASMAAGVIKNTGADFSLSITGIAGPEGGSQEKPVGLVYIGLAWKEGVSVTKNLFLGSREIIKFQSSQKALDMLRRFLIRSHMVQLEGR
ncbi:MAG: competence/damage-inducible protein A [Candidatus Aminicenantes bacterium]|nr:competence/damage-inducible protein A [Candidatus Aminicenantes bacterium]